MVLVLLVGLVLEVVGDVLVALLLVLGDDSGLEGLEVLVVETGLLGDVDEGDVEFLDDLDQKGLVVGGGGRRRLHHPLELLHQVLDLLGQGRVLFSQLHRHLGRSLDHPHPIVVHLVDELF